MIRERNVTLSCFKAYDVRGRVPDELNEDLAFRIGQAFCAHVRPNLVVIGYDVRISSPGLAEALIKGITSAGAGVLDIGMCGTEEVYFATASQAADGGMQGSDAVDDGDARPDGGHALITREHGDAGHGLADGVVADLVAVRPKLTVRRDIDHDDAWVELLEFFVAEAHLLYGAGPEVLDQDI